MGVQGTSVAWLPPGRLPTPASFATPEVGVGPVHQRSFSIRRIRTLNIRRNRSVNRLTAARGRQLPG